MNHSDAYFFFQLFYFGCTLESTIIIWPKLFSHICILLGSILFCTCSLSPADGARAPDMLSVQVCCLGILCICQLTCDGSDEEMDFIFLHVQN